MTETKGNAEPALDLAEIIGNMRIARFATGNYYHSAFYRAAHIGRPICPFTHRLLSPLLIQSACSFFEEGKSSPQAWVLLAVVCFVP